MSVFLRVNAPMSMSHESRAADRKVLPRGRSAFPTLVLPCMIFLAAACGWGESVRGASPNLTSVRPPGGQRGGLVTVSLAGARLTDAAEVMFYQPGVTVEKLDVVNDKLVKAAFRIAPDCRLGLYDFRLRTKTGVSELRSFCVGALPEVEEKEPNNDFAAPQKIPMNHTVTGIANREDVDYFVVDAKKGERLTAEIEGIRLGITLFDPYVAIRDADRFELITNDDAAAAWQDAIASVIAPKDGRYIIEVRESAYAGDANCLYRLHVGNFPRPRAVYPAGGKWGSSQKVTWLGDVRGPRATTVQLPAVEDPDREFALFASDDEGTTPFPQEFRISTLDNLLETEPNDNARQANPFTPAQAANGIIETPGDMDAFVFPAKKGESYHVRVHARSLRSPLDPVMVISRKGAGTIASNDDQGSPDCYVKFTAPATGEYIISVRDHLRGGGPTYVYRIELTPVQPKLDVTTTAEEPRRGTATIAVAAPQGNRQSFLVQATRQDFGGELAFTPQYLPAGMTMVSMPMSANVNQMPVVFEAAKDAPVAGRLAKLIGRLAATDAAIQPTSTFRHTATLVYGQNNRSFWARQVTRFAAVVANPAPFTINFVQPKAPLVRNGSLALKVTVQRAPNFKGDIVLLVPWMPPGVSAAGGVRIPAAATEAVVTLNASSGAALGEWPLVVDGLSRSDTDRFKVSTQLGRLNVAAPYLTMSFQPASVEQGKDLTFPADVTITKEFPGDAVVELKGLPHKVVAEPLKIRKDTQELTFRIKTDPSSPAGQHKNIFAEVTVMENGEPVVHRLGSGVLRLDKPLPPRPAAKTAATTTATAAKTTKANPADAKKPLSRLEQLRQDYQERMTGGNAEATSADAKKQQQQQRNQRN